MKVKLTKDISGYKEGQEVEVTEERANYWKRVGVAKEVKAKEEKEAPAKAPTKSATKAATKGSAK